MGNPLASVTKVALEEMVLSHVEPSKFGYFMSKDQLESLVRELASFVETSRSLRAAGDRFMNQKPDATQVSGRRSSAVKSP